MKTMYGVKKILFLFVFIMTIMVSYLNYSQSKYLLDEINLNTEALAINEGSGGSCMGIGSLDCPYGGKVRIIAN